MAQKSQEKGVTGPAPVVDDPSRVRNVVVVGHSSAGKTTLVEALLAATDTIPRAGLVTEGTTVSDYDPAAQKQQRSVALACAPLVHEGIKVNLLDTPGYADFVGELRAGLRAADAALFVVSSVDGMDAATAALWEECAAVGMPRAVAIARLDHQRHDYDETLANCQEVFGDNVLPLYLPMLGDDGESVVGLYGLITQRVFDYSAGYPPEVRDPDPEHLSAIEESRNALLEGDHRRERGRDAHGALPRRRGHRDLGHHRGPREGRRPGHLLPGGPRVRRDRRRPRRPPGGAHQRLPVAAGALRAGGHHGRRCPARAAHRRPRRTAGRRGRQDDHRLVRGARVARPRLLRHPAPRASRAHLRSRHGRARTPRPRRRRALRPPVLAARRQPARGALRDRRRHRRDHQVDHGGDRRHDLLARSTRC